MLIKLTSWSSHAQLNPDSYVVPLINQIPYVHEGQVLATYWTMGRQSGFDLYRFWHHSDFLWKSGIEEYFANSLLKGLPVLLDLPNRELLEFRVHRLRHLRRFDVSIDDLVLPGQLLGEFRFRHNERLYSCEKICSQAWYSTAWSFPGICLG